MQPQAKHKYDDLLKHEGELRRQAKQKEIALLEIKLYNLKSNYEGLRKRNSKGLLSVDDQDRMLGFWEDIGSTGKALHQLEKELQRLNDEDERYKKGANQVYEGTNNVEQKTGKNRLYIGNRQFVATYAANDDKKKKRTLDIGIWSWGLNFAWIEGGIDARVEVKIKLNESYPPHPYESMPEAAMYEILAHPTMSGAAWMKLCEKHPGSILWVNYGDENRPSWTALEIKACLDAGYRFVAYEHKNREGQALKLVKH